MSVYSYRIDLPFSSQIILEQHSYDVFKWHLYGVSPSKYS